MEETLLWARAAATGSSLPLTPVELTPRRDHVLNVEIVPGSDNRSSLLSNRFLHSSHLELGQDKLCQINVCS